MDKMSTPSTTVFLERLDAVEKRLMRDYHLRPGALTSPDTKTGERWDAGQVWAHLAEILSYWLKQAETVLAAHSPQPVPFGRIKSDKERVSVIARDRYVDVDILRERLREQIAALYLFLKQRDEADWLATGEHQARGVMSMERIVDEFMIGHLEEHAHQLDDLDE